MERDAPYKHMSEWLKPSAIFGIINLVILVMGGLVYMTRSEAAIVTRVITIENRIDYQILPTLRRIENKVETK